ncbi:MAG: SDR family oxidoreductase, partial [Dyella sp.]|nr:SDR family oxidoreductase [Dyella sp.]
MDGAVLITGCSSGIGRALARTFQRHGLNVIATARRPETLADIGPGIATETLDVTDAQSIDSLVARLAGAGTRVAMLVNNAGYGAMGPLAELPVKDFRDQFETNVIGTHAVTRAFLPAMIAARQGTIINIASVVGVVATPFAGAYCASKFAVNGMSAALRMELAPFGVRVVIVQPGAIRSQFGQTASALARRSSVDTGPY